MSYEIRWWFFNGFSRTAQYLLLGLVVISAVAAAIVSGDVYLLRNVAPVQPVMIYGVPCAWDSLATLLTAMLLVVHLLTWWSISSERSPQTVWRYFAFVLECGLAVGLMAVASARAGTFNWTFALWTVLTAVIFMGVFGVALGRITTPNNPKPAAESFIPSYGFATLNLGFGITVAAQQGLYSADPDIGVPVACVLFGVWCLAYSRAVKRQVKSSFFLGLNLLLGLSSCAVLGFQSDWNSEFALPSMLHLFAWLMVLCAAFICAGRCVSLLSESEHLMIQLDGRGHRELSIYAMLSATITCFIGSFTMIVAQQVVRAV